LTFESRVLAATLAEPSRPARRIAVLVPCYNEEQTIARVVEQFTAVIPGAAIYVYDNNSRDRTIEVARRAGAIVRSEPLQGKGNVVRRMFADVEADIYVLVDGDATYEAEAAPRLIKSLIDNQLDMVVGARVADQNEAYRRGHRMGNTLFTSVVGMLFGKRFTDIFSGYRVFSRRFVKSFPALTKGFEIETELTVHALALNMPVAELPTQYGVRPEGSASKLNTYRDGFHILMTIGNLFKDERPFAFFFAVFAALFALAVALATPLVVTFLQTGLVPRLPTAVLVTGITLLAFLALACGMILDTVTHGRREIRRLGYLAIPGVAANADDIKRR
jgi:glycosyltransferase involved in cell wall biosynthesis